ncbi:MAG TPA: PEP/pyruvate-binding domain-containing protein [Candidatus Eisenbacteria bacterium]|nr:PEP/pyruvate-binding domain-containing protein [Candidatus Eisenbacteria bacterium]
MSAPSAGVSRSWIHVPGGDQAAPVEQVGGKGHHLERLLALARGDAGFCVPSFVVVTTRAYDTLVGSARPWPADEAQARARAAEVRAAPLPPELEHDLPAALKSSGLDRRLLAVRSSAAAEDSAARSFAGQFDSVLGVRADDDLEALKRALRQVWASAFNAWAAAYGAAGGAVAPVRMAVVIQEMVDPRVSGVAFSADPVSGARHTAVVSAVHGLGEGLVSGELDADTYRVRFASDSVHVESSLARKTHAVRLTASGGTQLEALPEERQDAPALGDEEAKRVARVARQLERAFGSPQDIEWALGGAPDRLFVLQARPITTLGSSRVAPRTGERWVWDNSNIIESYSGVTTPLTFTFAREVYESVYRQFCRLMGTPEALIESHQPVFANMLGLVRGRVYYNLLNWYRTLALLPGFQFNRSFMERMMGVREALEDPPPPPSAGNRLRDLASLTRMILRMVREAGKLQREVPAFHARVESAIGPLRHADVSAWPAAEALALYHQLERRLLEQWRPPLVNDFFAMVFFGVLSRLTERWLPGSPPTLVNDLLCGEGGIVSTEPARRVMALAGLVRQDPELIQAFAAEPDDRQLLARLERLPGAEALVREIHRYLDDFGDRCMEELKLETVTLGEDPAFLIAMIRAYATRGTTDPKAAWERERAIRRGAEAQVKANLEGWKHALYQWVLVRARRRVRDRENLRFERTRVFGVVRRIVIALGRDLARQGRIADARDVFHLTRHELFAAFEGGSNADLQALVRERRERFESWARETPPPDRFETYGAPGAWGPDWIASAESATLAPGAGAAELRGTGCCPGVVKAPVRVVRDPRGARDLEGKILVAERTDPGWTLLFPAVRGLLVQRGSLLSHSAIVAREMGLPCVVGIPGLLDILEDGEVVEMDGAAGVVRRQKATAAS